MEQEVNTVSGITENVDGKLEVWYNGECYGCVIPEEMIDEEIRESKKENGGKRNEE